MLFHVYAVNPPPGSAALVLPPDFLPEDAIVNEAAAEKRAAVPESNI